MGAVPVDPPRRPLTFLVVVALLSLPFYIAGVFGALHAGALRLPLSAAMFVVPALAGVGLTVRDRGWAAGWRMVRDVWDVPPARTRWYATAVGLFVAVAVAAYCIARAAGVAGTGLPVAPPTIPVLIVVFASAAAAEELGWTGYATDPLRARIGDTGAGLVLGGYWALWHLLPLTQAGHGPVWIGGWFAGTVAARVIIVWLHVRAGGVGVAVLAHTTINLTAACTPGYDSTVVPVTGAVLLVTVAAVVSVPCARTRSAQGGLPGHDESKPIVRM